MVVLVAIVIAADAIIMTGQPKANGVSPHLKILWSKNLQICELSAEKGVIMDLLTARPKYMQENSKNMGIWNTQTW